MELKTNLGGNNDISRGIVLNAGSSARGAGGAPLDLDNLRS